MKSTNQIDEVARNLPKTAERPRTIWREDSKLFKVVLNGRNKGYQTYNIFPWKSRENELDTLIRT